jgi:hypothetical protein
LDTDLEALQIWKLDRTGSYMFSYMTRMTEEFIEFTSNWIEMVGHRAKLNNLTTNGCLIVD